MNIGYVQKTWIVLNVAKQSVTYNRSSVWVTNNIISKLRFSWIPTKNRFRQTSCKTIGCISIPVSWSHRTNRSGCCRTYKSNTKIPRKIISYETSWLTAPFRQSPCCTRTIGCTPTPLRLPHSTRRSGCWRRSNHQTTTRSASWLRSCCPHSYRYPYPTC